MAGMQKYIMFIFILILIVLFLNSLNFDISVHGDFSVAEVVSHNLGNVLRMENVPLVWAMPKDHVGVPMKQRICVTSGDRMIQP
jgi:regulatory protein YycI of two-component signal transduction system YycFG